MKAPCFDPAGKRSGDVDLPKEVFSIEYKADNIHKVIQVEQANGHQGTHKAKGRSEVSGGGKKPWRQKGTGNARQGSTRAPQWRGGGVVFGPHTRSYHIALPKKQRKAGIRSIFSSRAKEGAISVLKGFELKEYNTKKTYQLFKEMGLVPHSTVVFITDSEETYIKKSFANLRNIHLMHVKRITAPQVFYAGRIVIAEAALPYLAKHYQRASLTYKKSGAA